jgi:hypothetical protein
VGVAFVPCGCRRGFRAPAASDGNVCLLAPLTRGRTVGTGSEYGSLMLPQTALVAGSRRAGAITSLSLPATVGCGRSLSSKGCTALSEFLVDGAEDVLRR